MEAANLPAFQYLEMQKTQISAVCMIQDHFPQLFKIFFPDLSLTTQIP